MADDDSGVGENARLIYTPTASGTYYVQASNISAVDEGTYTLSVIVLGANGASEADTDFPATTATTGRVEVGASATGNLTDPDYDWFRVDLEAGKTYQFDLEGEPTDRGILEDPVLGLYDDSSNAIVTNDDASDTTLNSQIVHTVTATGTYYLEVSSVTITHTGTYTLSVRDIRQATCTLNTGDIWCGVLTPASHLVDGVAFAHGFVDATPDTGALSDKEFSVVTDGVTNSYTIVAVAIGVGNATGSLSFSLTSALTAADAAKLVLHVDGSSDQFAFSVSGNLYVWPRTDLDWSSGDPVTLRLRDTAAATPPDAPTGFTATVGDAQVALAWKAARLYSGVTGHEFRYKTDGDYPEDWTAIAYSGPDEANEDGSTVTGLTNEAAHTFELRAVNAAGGGDAATAEPVTPTPGICDRTQKIQDAILAELSGVDDCAAVTVANLASITTLGSFGFGTFNQGITSLQKGDFAGLTSLTILNLGINGLTSLPEGIFAGLAELTELNLSVNQLESLPEGAFAGLAELFELNLSVNQLESLPEGAFAGLTALEVLQLAGNDLSSLPEDLFSGLTALDILALNENDLSSLPEDLFSGLTALTYVNLDDNKLTMLPEGLFSGLTALTRLELNNNALDSLPEGLFSGLTALTRLELRNNALDSLPEGLFSGLTALTGLELINNALDSLPEGLFSGLTALTELELNNNALDSLPEGLFSGLTALDQFLLDGNSTNPMELTVTVEKVGTNQVRAKVLAGAPFAVDIPVTLVDGTLAGSATALSVAAGSVEGTAVTVTRTAGTTAAVTVDVDLTTQPTLPSGHQGYIFKKASTNLPATILPDATLSALSLGTGVTLDPTFAPGTTSYTAAVGNAVDEVTVTATTTDTNATPEFLDASDAALADADDVANGHQVALAVGDTVFKVQVTAADGTTTQTYTVTVTRAAQAQEADVLVSNIDQPVASGSVDTSRLDIAQGFMTGASPSGNFALTSVNLKLAAGGTSPVVTVVTDNSGQPGSLHATLVPPASVVAGDNMFTAPPGTTLDAGTPYFLVISGGTGVPSLAFTSSTDEVSDTDADDWTIGDFSRYRSIGATGDYDRSFNVILLISVNGTAVGGDTPPPPSTDATLSALSLGTGVTLDPIFVSGTTSYTAAVGNAVDEVTVTPTTTDTNATPEFLNASDTTLDDADDVANGQQVALAVGDNVFKVKVTAEDGTTTETYTVTVTRAAADTPTCTLNTGDIWCGVLTPVSYLVNGVEFGHGFVDGTPDTGALSDEEFSVVTDGVANSYTIRVVFVGVGSNTGSLSFRLTSALTAAERAKLDLHVEGRSDPLAFSVASESASNAYVWTGTGLDWSSGDPVTLRLREASTPSTDATLSGLAVNDGSTDLTLDPTFAPGTTSYTAAVGNAVDEVTVTATTTDTNATPEFLDASDTALDDADDVANGHQVALAVGDNVFKVQVTAEDGTTTQTYTVTVTRAAAGTPTVAIAADQPAFTGRLDNVIFTLTRTGDAAAALDVAVALTQDQTLLTSGNRAQTVTFGAGNATATLTLGYSIFQTVTQEATLTATVQAGSGYAPGSPNTANTRILAADPAVTASIEETAYTFAEDAADTTVAVILRTAPGVPVPNQDISVSLSLRNIPGQAVAGDDYTRLARVLSFRPSDFTSDGAVFTARQDVTLAIVDDALEEPDETLTLRLELAALTSQLVAFSQADDTACSPDAGICDVTVTITDNDASTVTIAADQPAFTATLDNVTFTLTRTGDPAAALDVAVALTQDQDLLESATLAQTVSFGAGDATATLRLLPLHFEEHTVTQETTLTATVQAGSGYAPGSPNTASTRIVVTNPAVTASIEETAYTFAEDADATVAVIARTATGVPSPNVDIYVSLRTQAIPGQAVNGVDYTALSVSVRFRPSDFTSEGAVFTARQEVTLAIVDDLFDELDETLTLQLQRTAGLSEVVALRQADGTVCPGLGCDVTVTIRDNDDPAPSAAGPPPTDNFYLWTTIITVGESSGTLGYDASGGYGELSTGAVFFYPTFAPPPKHHFDPGSALTVTSLRRFADSNGDQQLRLKLAGLGDTGNVTLWIGDKRFPVTADNYDSTVTEYHWPSTALNPPKDDPAGLEWEEDDQVRVTLVYERARPSAPTYLTVKAPPGEDGTLEVRWEAPDTEGTFPTTHYLVEFLPVGDPRRVERSYVPVETTSVTHTDLQTGAEYRVLVQALSGDGYGSEATRTITTNGVPASCAPNPGDLWCGVITVGHGGGNNGYDTENVNIGDLSDTDFDVGPNSYTIVGIFVDGETSVIPGTLSIVFHPNSRPTAADRDTLVLQVDGSSDSFAFSDAFVVAGRSVSWTSADLDWSEEEYVILRLRQKTASAGAEESGAPLTAAFEGLPEAHDGETAFTFRIAFSEAVSVTPEAMRTRVLTVTGGAVTGAARVDGEPGVWAITVTPDTREELSITLAPTAACEADGAVCTADGRALSIGAAHLVSGPPDDARESNTEATGTPTISGTPQVGETLTADTSGIADDDGLKNVSFSYQWLADDTAIQGATGSAYTLIEADERKTVRVRVSFTDDTGNGETLTSTATDAVAAAPQPNNPATGAPAINGTAQVGETLTADTSGIADTDGLTSVSYSYQWLAGDSDISGATGSAYTLADADEGKTVTVRVSFTDDGGNDETLTSAATDAVAGNEEPVAREDVAAWSATMTVEWVYRGYGYYSTDTKKAGSLSPASFKVDGTTYTVKMVETQGWWMYIGVDRELPFDFVLELDGARFASGDASFRSYNYGNIYWWEGTGLSWRDGDTVEVRLLRAFEDETAVNSAATGAPIISGTVQVGETLTADTSGIEDADGLDNAAFTYQWLADNAAIAGATGSTYTLADADEGKAIAVQVSFTDDAGNNETLASAATDAVAAAPPENNEATGAPSISGTAQVGETLTVDTSGIADTDGLENSAFTYQWLADDTAIQGAMGSSYTLADTDEGKAISVHVSFTDDTGNGETLTSTATDAVAAATQPNNPATGAPAINGTAQVGETLTADTSGIADTDGLTSVTYSYQWLAGGSDISGATGSAYTLADADEGKTVTVRVSFTDDGGNDETLTSAATEAVAGNEEPVAREDVAAWSATMTVEWVYRGYGYYSTDAKKAGSLSPASFEVDGTTYTVKMVETQGWWMYIGVDRELPFGFVLELDGARFASGDASFRSYSYGNIYRWEGTGLSWRDGDTVEVRLLRAVEDETAVNSAATGAPIISGTVQVGETLTADTSGIADADGLDNATFTYQWLADNAAIAGATGSTYTLADADEGKAIAVQVSFTDDAGNDETLASAATETVSFAVQPQVANSPATGAPTISGTVQVGETLTADTSGIADENGLENLTFTYQWLADDDAIAGATDSTYTLADADEGKAIKVQVSFTDDAGNDETLTSAATDAVAAPEPPASPTGLSATASHDSVTLSWDDPGDDSVTGYVILRRNRDIHAEGEFTTLVEDTGAATTTYTDDTVEPETPYTYRIKAINEHGESERSRWFHIDTPAAPTPEPTPESPAEPPASPTGLAADVSHDSVTLTWDDPGDDSITGYVILRRDSAIHEEGTFETVESDTGSAETTYTDDSAQPERKYVYRIKAINKHGLSEISSWVRAYTPAAPVPAAPTGLSASASHDSVTLTWDDPGDDSITGYVILRRNRDIDAEGEFTTLVENTGAAATTYTDDSVASDTPYTYRIKAINEHGESERSRWFHIQTQEAP